VRDQLRQLYCLQQLTRQAAEVRHEIQKLSAGIELQKEILEEKKRRAEEVHSRRIAAAREADATQLKIDEAEQEIERLKVQLNTTRHQKEYDAIQHTILGRTADIRRWEDQELAAFETVDRLKLEEERLAEQIRRAEAELESAVAESRASLDEQHRRLDELQARAEALRKNIAPEVLASYDRLSARHPTTALAFVRDRTCQGCFTRVTKQTLNLLLHGREIVYCHSCGRMLMLED